MVSPSRSLAHSLARSPLSGTTNAPTDVILALSPAPNRFDFGGSSVINTNKHIRLTQDRKSQAGWLWSRLVCLAEPAKVATPPPDLAGSADRLCACQPLTPTAFEVEFEFRVDGKSNSLYGDGFAMWLTKERAGFGPVFGSTGEP